MSFLSDKKKEHEDKALSALKCNDFGKAFAHAIKVAEFNIQLAQQTDGLVSKAYVTSAREWLDLASKIKEKMKSRPVLVPDTSGNNTSQDNKNGSNSSPEDEDSSIADSWLVRDKPNVKLDDVAGLEEVKIAIREDIQNAILHPELYKTFGINAGGGILLFGPPGTGKTFVAKAVAGELDAAFFSVSGSQIRNKYVGETEKNMRRLFEEADKYERSVIFIDEAETLLKERNPEDKVSAVTEFLVLTDGLKPRKNTLLLLGGTNYPWLLDQAVLRSGRFGKRIYVGLPDPVARKHIFKSNLKDIQLDPYIKLDDLVTKTDGYSGADIKGICERAKKKAISRIIDTKSTEEILLFSDIDEALKSTPPSVTNEQVQQYLDWKKEWDNELQ